MTMARNASPVVRGSVVVHRRRCGKANCRCAEGVNLHESTVLSYSEAGRTKFLMLPPEEVAAVRAAVDRYRAAKSAVEEQSWGDDSLAWNKKALSSLRSRPTAWDS